LISRQEIMDFSREFGLSPTIVEKDYLLGWILAGISNHGELGSDWVFKGGTCLKKCYFETYRFSEDLDFTIKNADHCNQEFLRNAFEEIADWVYEEAGIEIPRELIHFEIYSNPRGKISVQGRISYRGPLQPRGDLPRVKLDLTNDEILVLDPVNREAHHPYSDRPEESFHILCYCFEELFAEKIRALGERFQGAQVTTIPFTARYAVEVTCFWSDFSTAHGPKDHIKTDMEHLNQDPPNKKNTKSWTQIYFQMSSVQETVCT
jgi:predicted nucleotidyltransferase component of viral defense system